MIGSKFSRNLLFALVLGTIVTVIMLSLFYGQYRWLAGEIVAASAAEHELFLRQSFERRVRAQMHGIADDFALTVNTADSADVLQGLNRALGRNEMMTSMRFSDAQARTLQVGNFPTVDLDAAVTWLPDSLIMTYPVGGESGISGQLTGVFQLDQLHAESAAFATQLADKELERRRSSYAWIGAGTLAMLLVCGLVVLLVARDQTRRIRDLKLQAEKLRASDFGDRLPENRDDELGELAAVFNAMRDRLKTTTISRDYVDSVLSSMNDAIIVTTSDGTIKRINRATTHLLGFEEDELIDTSIDYIVNSKKSRSIIDDPQSGLPSEAFFESKFGESIPVSYTCSILEGLEAESGDRIYAAQNITERRRAEQRIRYLARIDALTKVPNRMQFQHLLQRAIARGRRNRRSLCLFYVDIDHFKEINDTFGHLAGDTTLETVAERLTACLPENSVIGRLAGDEFAVIVEGASADKNGMRITDEIAKELLARLADPLFVQGHEVFMTASMGVAFYPQDAANVIDLIRNADAALYHAKKSGGNMHSYYEPAMNEASVERLMTKSKLKRAFERDELLVHYQPKYNLETGEVFGAEALVRWELPERGMILPADFIPIAEETNLIIEIGEWVLDKVCEDFRYWQRSVSSPGRVSVNLSLKQLRQRNFTQRISSILRSYEVSPTSLELEITETTLMENPERTIQLLDQLYALGLHLAIDDFGTGYSSLSALQQFPISTLKIDKSFVRNVATSPDDATLIGTIVQMGQNMNMDVVAEGVESEDQLNFLRSIGCTYVQGLLFGEPMSSDSYLELLLAQMEGTDSYRALFA
ncbi:MAG: EAL domain-containing protein [Gammaproteobacteria bacterium]|nr:EAL domain-containing protein [Gammaproteobacteria bacterium]